MTAEEGQIKTLSLSPLQHKQPVADTSTHLLATSIPPEVQHVDQTNRCGRTESGALRCPGARGRQVYGGSGGLPERWEGLACHTSVSDVTRPEHPRQRCGHRQPLSLFPSQSSENHLDLSSSTSDGTLTCNKTTCTETPPHGPQLTTSAVHR